MQKLDQIRMINICRVHQGARQCRYLINAACLKQHIYAKDVIDFRVIKGTQTAFGDNCDGVPFAGKTDATQEPAL